MLGNILLRNTLGVILDMKIISLINKYNANTSRNTHNNLYCIFNNVITANNNKYHIEDIQ